MTTTLRSSYYCTQCGWLPRSAFYPGSLRAGETRCKHCNSRARRQRRRGDPIQRLQWKIYLYERKHRAPHPYPSRTAVEALVQRSTHTADHRDVCAVRYFEQLPLSECPWNAVLLTTGQARRLPRDAPARCRAFPPHIQAEMASQASSNGQALGATVS